MNREANKILNAKYHEKESVVKPRFLVTWMKTWEERGECVVTGEEGDLAGNVSSRFKKDTIASCEGEMHRASSYDEVKATEVDKSRLGDDEMEQTAFRRASEYKDLLAMVIRQIQCDLQMRDEAAIEELLCKLPHSALQSYLPVTEEAK
tara:strand:+ start:275 stop:721 length:447 start_codon:yes stop_codon:yes gene_type:complete